MFETSADFLNTAHVIYVSTSNPHISSQLSCISGHQSMWHPIGVSEMVPPEISFFCDEDNDKFDLSFVQYLLPIRTADPNRPASQGIHTCLLSSFYFSSLLLP